MFCVLYVAFVSFFHLNHVCRVIVVLEGGYNLLCVGSGCEAIARVLLEPAPIPLHASSKCSTSEEGTVLSGTISAIQEVCRQHAQSWPVLAASEPTEPPA